MQHAADKTATATSVRRDRHTAISGCDSLLSQGIHRHRSIWDCDEPAPSNRVDRPAEALSHLETASEFRVFDVIAGEVN